MLKNDPNGSGGQFVQAYWLTAKRLRAHGAILALCLWSLYAWNLATPNGIYYVHIVAGDPSYFDSNYKIEGDLRRIRARGEVNAAQFRGPAEGKGAQAE